MNNRPYGVDQEIHTVPDLLYAISRASDQDQRRSIINRAQYLGLAHKVPNDWNPDGSLKSGE